MKVQTDTTFAISLGCITWKAEVADRTETVVQGKDAKLLYSGSQRAQGEHALVESNTSELARERGRQGQLAAKMARRMYT